MISDDDLRKVAAGQAFLELLELPRMLGLLTELIGGDVQGVDVQARTVRAAHPDAADGYTIW